MPSGRQPPCIGLALTEKDIVETDNPASACTGCPLAGDYQGRGALTVPFILDGRVYGVMSVSIPREVARDANEKLLLRDLAVDIAFGLRALELEEARDKATKALIESEERFRDLLEKCPIGIFIIQGSQVVYQNPRQKELLGPLPRSFDLGTFEGLHPEDAEKYSGPLEIIQPILFLLEYVLAVVSALYGMMAYIGDNEASVPWHH